MDKGNGVRVLVVDDEPNIRQFIELGLLHEGYTVRTAADGIEGVEAAESFKPHVVVLDIMMPGPDGLQVCARLKDARPVAVIMLTAKDEVEDRIQGLRTGADDYMPKPFSFGELIARIQARVRNQFPHLLEEAVVGPFRIDDRRKDIRYRERSLELSPTEYELLRCLLFHQGTVLSKSAILDKVWGYDFGGEENIVEVYVRALREKLGDKEHRLIRTIRGAGYRVDL